MLKIVEAKNDGEETRSVDDVTKRDYNRCSDVRIRGERVGLSLEMKS